MFPSPNADDNEDDTGHFISAVCWKSESPTMLAANSQGTTKVLELAPWWVITLLEAVTYQIKSGLYMSLGERMYNMCIIGTQVMSASKLNKESRGKGAVRRWAILRGG